VVNCRLSWSPAAILTHATISCDYLLSHAASVKIFVSLILPLLQVQSLLSSASLAMPAITHRFSALAQLWLLSGPRPLVTYSTPIQRLNHVRPSALCCFLPDPNAAHFRFTSTLSTAVGAVFAFLCNKRHAAFLAVCASLFFLPIAPTLAAAVLLWIMRAFNKLTAALLAVAHNISSRRASALLTYRMAALVPPCLPVALIALVLPSRLTLSPL